MFCLLVIASEIFLLCISYIPGCNDLSWENLDNVFFSYLDVILGYETHGLRMNEHLE